MDYAEKYKKFIATKNISLLEPYLDSKTKILHKCNNCNNQWEISSANIKRSPNCPSCKSKRTSDAWADQYYSYIKTRKDIRNLEPYTKNLDKILHKCLVCGDIWKAAPKVIKRGHGCPKCAGKKPSNTEEYKQYLKDNYKSVECLGSYINDYMKIEHKCLKCSYIWNTAPGYIKQNYMCPACGGSKPITHEEYSSYLKATGIPIQVLEKYINNKIKIKHKCLKCANEWLVSPEKIKYGRGCPKCSKTGFDSSKPGTLYFIYFEILGLYKIGISNKVENRLKNFGYIPTVLATKEFKVGEGAKVLERLLLKDYKEYTYNSGELISGNTETLVKVPEAEIINRINNGY